MKKMKITCLFFFASAKLAKIVYAPQNGDINRTFVAFKKN